MSVVLGWGGKEAHFDFRIFLRTTGGTDFVIVKTSFRQLKYADDTRILEERQEDRL